MFAAIFKKKNVVGEKKHQEVLMANYTLRFYIYILLKFHIMGDCVTHARYAQNRIADTISIKISCASYRSFFL